MHPFILIGMFAGALVGKLFADNQEKPVDTLANNVPASDDSVKVTPAPTPPTESLQ